MRDPFMLLMVSFTSGLRTPLRKSSITTTSHTQRRYSLIPNVWKFLEAPKQQQQQQQQILLDDDHPAVELKTIQQLPVEDNRRQVRDWYRLAQHSDKKIRTSSSADVGFFQDGDFWSSEERLVVSGSNDDDHDPTTATNGITSSSSSIGTVHPWCGAKYYSDLITKGLDWLASKTALPPPKADSKRQDMVIMMLESPTSWTPQARQHPFAFSSSSKAANHLASFCNKIKFPIHDYPVSGLEGKTVMGPLRYGCMTGNAFSSFLRHAPPPGLVEHWSKAIPNFVPPTFSHSIPSKSQTICAYVPLERFTDQQHLIDPYVHYQLGGKDCIPYMTSKTTKLLPNTRTVRPCVVKVTHAMGSRGIFIIRNDADEMDCFQHLQETGRPPFVVTEFVNIQRSLAAHFFIHPSGELTWFGTSENMVVKDDGKGIIRSCSDDATIWCNSEQAKLQRIMMPFVRDVAQYCLSRGYWGPCGIDVLMDDSSRRHGGRNDNGGGYVVDVNPRVTGTCPALMVFTKLSSLRASPSNQPFQHGTFRRSKNHAFPGTAQELLRQVNEFNEQQNCQNNISKNKKACLRIVLFSLYQKSPTCTLLNIAVYGPSKEECDKVLDQFAPKLLVDEENDEHGKFQVNHPVITAASNSNNALRP